MTHGHRLRRIVFFLLRTGIGLALAALLIRMTLKASDLSVGDLIAALRGANRLLLLLSFWDLEVPQFGRISRHFSFSFTI